MRNLGRVRLRHAPASGLPTTLFPRAGAFLSHPPQHTCHGSQGPRIGSELWDFLELFVKHPRLGHCYSYQRPGPGFTLQPLPNSPTFSPHHPIILLPPGLGSFISISSLFPSCPSKLSPGLLWCPTPAVLSCFPSSPSGFRGVSSPPCLLCSPWQISTGWASPHLHSLSKALRNLPSPGKGLLVERRCRLWGPTPYPDPSISPPALVFSSAPWNVS